ncbi:MAG: helix-turn-helix transcriptional regulator, partial [Thermoleophilia bacterium]|nr:helix-turn-helix transcriptional regulator [Thermoleophilia bacterium]
VAALPDGLVLVLDDYHLVDANPVDEVLAFMLEHLPSQMHVVIATREDPDLPLARMRARGQLAELRAADLRFSPAEAAEFLNRAMGLELSSEDVAALETRTEGWIAGLQMAALALQGAARQGAARQGAAQQSATAAGGRPDTAAFIQAFAGSHRFVLDYLVEEILRRQTERIRDFLVQTSVLDTLCGALCDAVTGQKDGRRTLADLEHSNLFVVPLDDERRWYRYHHLFADVLRVRMLDERSDQVAVLHGRASEWYEQEGMRPDAIRHSLMAQDFDRAADLIELTGSPANEGSQIAAWLRWVRALPAESVHSRPVLSVWYAYALLGAGDLEGAEVRLADAERWLDLASHPGRQPGPGSGMIVADEEHFRLVPASIGIARSYLAQARGDAAGTVKHAQQVLDFLPDDHIRRTEATALLAMTSWVSGDLEVAERSFVDVVRSLKAAGNLVDAISALLVVADIRVALGRLSEAASVLEDMLRLVRDQGGSILPDAADLYRGLGEICLERGDLDGAAKHFLTSKGLGEQALLPLWRCRWHIAQARLSQARGDLDVAADLLDEADRNSITTARPDLDPIAARRARIHVAQGRLAEALKWVSARGLTVGDPLSFLGEFEHITLARVLIASQGGGPEDPGIVEALGLLERLLAAAKDGGRVTSVIEILALQALAHEAVGDVDAALAPLERALKLAASEGHVRVFVDEGPPMFRLLREAASRHVAPETTSRVLAVFASAKLEGADLSGSVSAGPELLSRREVEVLGHIAAGLTNQEIAARLYLSLYTVKAHARTIYSKLSAQNRTQAVAKARELGILPRL